ncbi:MAG: type I-U CRISPR-associated helicase/endonuclease Cas3 [Planctomycetes bacterium]|nr:type I-U CRISPR-associated helicase/endonuclease Cas3 [Planctomycetota bacterium]
MSTPTPDQFEAFYQASTLAIAELELAERQEREPDHEPEKSPTAKDPFPWQSRLAKRVCAGDWPRAIALPTAAGKTACIDIAVFALTCRAKAAPRRIFFVVDRRIVVDQAFDHAKKLAKVLDRAPEGVLRNAADVLREITEPGWLQLSSADRLRILGKRWAIKDETDETKRQKLLRGLTTDERQWFEVSPLDVYALRGGMYRESAWARSPLQPTIIASTVDQVGSRLLFRGYGVSPSMMPIHAGLVGNDSLILLDEAHCAKPFDQTMQAIEKYREWGEKNNAPFRFVSITATPREGVPREEANADDLAHPVLGKRINASKPTTLVIAEKAKGKTWKQWGKPLVEKLKEQAEELAKEFACVGIIVNRVATARELAAKLGNDAVLLTGRMRPLDRDRIFKEKLQPLLSNATGQPPKFVVGTQCLECGADFDFHALVTECASFDALRQRFGRLNRVANRKDAKAVIVIRGDQIEDTSEDPVYGKSLSNTWKWLNVKAPAGVFDFGVSAVRQQIEGMSSKELEDLNAPAPNAPVLFPAHLDCWVQTHPIPTPDPDPALFLHGPKQQGVPDVQVVFRSDLGEDSTQWAEIVSLCPPSSSEAVAVPISVFTKWMAGKLAVDDTADVSGGTPEEPDERDEEPQARFALRWRGPEESKTISDPSKVTPNDTYVIPCSSPDIEGLGDFLPEGITDYAEEAFQRSRDKALLRLPGLEIADEDEDFETRLSEAVHKKILAAFPAWSGDVVKRLTDERNRDCDRYPEPHKGFVITNRVRLRQFDPTSLDDGEPDESFKGRRTNNKPITLEDHSRGVADHAARFAAGCGLDVTLYTQAGLWHDLGKLDPRFQAMLKQSSPRTAVGVPLAKSAKSSGSKQDRDQTREIHKYPKGARHELLSAAMITTRTNDDLLLHLIATHHGSARPFANAVNDAPEKSDVTFLASLFDEPFECGTYRQQIQEWNAELPERFWRVVRKFGWWGAAYREAIFRLADHAQSAAEQERDVEPATVVASWVSLSAKATRTKLHTLPLTGLDGANPLAFLAALGTLRLADRVFPGTRMSWEVRGAWTPVLHLSRELSPTGLINELLATAGTERRCVSFVEDLKIPATDFRSFAMEAQGVARDNREFADFLAAYTDPLVTIQGGPNAGKTKPTEFYFIAGNQKLLKQARNIAGAVTEAHLSKALFSPWTYDDPLDGLSLRWDPLDDFRYATRFGNPSKDKSKARRGSVLGANRLAFEAIPFFPCFAKREKIVTTGFTNLKRRPFFTWPVWTVVWGVDSVRSSLSTLEPPRLGAEDQQVVPRVQLGIGAWFQCEKVANSDYSNFATASVV